MPLTINIIIGVDSSLSSLISGFTQAVIQNSNAVSQMEAKIMKQIDDFAAAVQAKLASINEQVSTIGSEVTKIAADEETLKAQIQDLINNGSFTAADQGKLDALSTSLDGIVTRTKGAADALTALDATVPDTPPPPAPAPVA